jgi:hypothetical protein
LRDEQRLRQHKPVRDEGAGATAASVRNEPERSPDGAYGDDRDPEDDMHGHHRAHPTERHDGRMVEERKPAPMFTVPSDPVEDVPLE